MKGRTLDVEEDNVSGRLTFEWLPGGFFLQQRVQIDFMGLDVHGLEVIAYDPATGKFPSTVYSNLVGVPIPYEYDVQGDRVTIRTELVGRPSRARGPRTAARCRAAGGRTRAEKVPATSPTTSAGDG